MHHSVTLVFLRPQRDFEKFLANSQMKTSGTQKPWWACLLPLLPHVSIKKKVNMFPLMEQPRKPVGPASVCEHARTQRGHSPLTQNKATCFLMSSLFRLRYYWDSPFTPGTDKMVYQQNSYINHVSSSKIIKSLQWNSVSCSLWADRVWISFI